MRSLVCTGLLATPVWAAQVDASQSGPPPLPGKNGPVDGQSIDPSAREHMAISRNGERQKELVEDTNHLLLLAQELKREMDDSNKDQLSVTVVKKSEEIEKLAKRVKERMRGY